MTLAFTPPATERAPPMRPTKPPKTMMENAIPATPATIIGIATDFPPGGYQGAVLAIPSGVADGGGVGGPSYCGGGASIGIPPVPASRADILRFPPALKQRQSGRMVHGRTRVPATR